MNPEPSNDWNEPTPIEEGAHLPPDKDFDEIYEDYEDCPSVEERYPDDEGYDEYMQDRLLEQQELADFEQADEYYQQDDFYDDCPF